MPIVRAIAGVIVGYIAMAAVIFASFTAAFLILKTDGSFKAGSYEVSTTWLVVSFVLGFIAAIIGGLVCALIAVRGSKAPLVLAGLVLVLGLLLAVPLITASDDAEPAVRTGEVTNLEAMSNAEQPAISAALNPIIGAVGIMIGARMRGKPRVSS